MMLYPKPSMTPIDHHLLMALMNTTPDRIYFKDRDGRFLLINRALREFHGVKDDSEILGKTDFDLFLPKHAKEPSRQSRAVLSTGKSIVAKLEREDLPDGRVTLGLDHQGAAGAMAPARSSARAASRAT